jgi:hypothetical protein
LLGACGKPANWSTWWILDGNDDAECLRAVDYKASLNEAIVEMQRNFHLKFCKKNMDENILFGVGHDHVHGHAS